MEEEAYISSKQITVTRDGNVINVNLVNRLEPMTISAVKEYATVEINLSGEYIHEIAVDYMQNVDDNNSNVTAINSPDDTAMLFPLITDIGLYLKRLTFMMKAINSGDMSFEVILKGCFEAGTTPSGTTTTSRGSTVSTGTTPLGTTSPPGPTPTPSPSTPGTTPRGTTSPPGPTPSPSPATPGTTPRGTTSPPGPTPAPTPATPGTTPRGTTSPPGPTPSPSPATPGTTPRGTTSPPTSSPTTPGECTEKTIMDKSYESNIEMTDNGNDFGSQALTDEGYLTTVKRERHSFLIKLVKTVTNSLAKITGITGKITTTPTGVTCSASAHLIQDGVKAATIKLEQMDNYFMNDEPFPGQANALELTVTCDASVNLVLSEFETIACFKPEEPYCEFSKEEFIKKLNATPTHTMIGFMDTDGDGELSQADEVVQLGDKIDNGLTIKVLCKYVKCVNNELVVSDRENCTECSYSKWTEWTPCSASCCGGISTRERKVLVIDEYCSRETTETKQCNIQPCSDTQWGEWSPWSNCSSKGTCRQGERMRTRECPMGAQCKGSKLQLEPCVAKGDCEETSVCDRPNEIHQTCVGDYIENKFVSCRMQYLRQRYEELEDLCIPGCVCKDNYMRNNDGDCVPVDQCMNCYTEAGDYLLVNGYSSGREPCELATCKATNGTYAVTYEKQTDCTCKYGKWCKWTPCSVTCGKGSRKRYRELVGNCNPKDAVQEIPCEEEPCPGDCVIDGVNYYVNERVPVPWNKDECEVCYCEYPGMAAGGVKCYPDNNKKRDGGWGDWSVWDTCKNARQCGPGLKHRTRDCNNPKPTCSGARCNGTDVDEQACSLKSCCDTTDWSEYSTCTATCDGGTKTRYRNFTEPSDTEASCNIKLTETEECNNQKCGCKVKYSDWSPCSVTCGPGTRSKELVLKEGDCDMPTKITEQCNLRDCPPECDETEEPDERGPCDTATCDVILFGKEAPCKDNNQTKLHCYCKEGYFKKGDKCVKPEECKKCMRDGVEYEEGEYINSTDHCYKYVCRKGEVVDLHKICDDPICEDGESYVFDKGACCPSCSKDPPGKCHLVIEKRRLKMGKCVSLNEIDVGLCYGGCGHSRMEGSFYMETGNLAIKKTCQCCTATEKERIPVETNCTKSDGSPEIGYFVNMLDCKCDVCGTP